MPFTDAATDRPTDDGARMAVDESPSAADPTTAAAATGSAETAPDATAMEEVEEADRAASDAATAPAAEAAAAEEKKAEVEEEKHSASAGEPAEQMQVEPSADAEERPEMEAPPGAGGGGGSGGDDSDAAPSEPEEKLEILQMAHGLTTKFTSADGDFTYDVLRVTNAAMDLGPKFPSDEAAEGGLWIALYDLAAIVLRSTVKTAQENIRKASLLKKKWVHHHKFDKGRGEIPIVALSAKR